MVADIQRLRPGISVSHSNHETYYGHQ